ncbi:MAG TPA: GntR family transcriptional regulator [Planctomycetota bacterium]|nr:GntR family transcriptional regulator [Planctomycetota bacterium]
MTQLPFKLDVVLNVPLYEQLYQGMKRSIQGGVLSPGTALPSERQIVDEFQITRPTLRKALENLERDGLIVRRHGVGTFVCNASQWRSEKSISRIGVLTWEQLGGYGKEIFGYVCSEAVAAGLQVKTLTGTGKAGIPDLAQQITRESLDGLIATPTNNRRHLQQLAAVALPKVILEVAPQMDGLDHVVIDCIRGVYEGVRELIRLGHREIMYIGGLIGDYSERDTPGIVMPAPDSEVRFGAYRRALADGGIAFRPEWFHELPYTPELWYEWFAKLKASGRMPTAFVVFDDMLAEHVFEACEQHGLKVPQDLSVLGFGNHMPRSMRGELATVEFDRKAMAELAVQRIGERLRQGGISGVTLRAGTKFKPGTSMGPPRK